MMDDTDPFAPAAPLPADAPAAPAAEPSSAPVQGPSPGNNGLPEAAPALSPAAPALSPAVVKFKSCRWRATPDVGEFCTHRDVLPFAGKEGFVAESWCPDCAFYKLRRTPKRRERSDYTY